MIAMFGTDHTIASVEQRSELFLTKERRVPVMEQMRHAVGADGLIMLSTCNRMEIWVSTPDSSFESEALMQAFCNEIGADLDEIRPLLVCRTEEEAVEHLFYLACGLKSAIVAEDQIVTQVREALDFSREKGLADSMLEVLFRSAVTAAKKVKTDVRFVRADATAVQSALALLEARGCNLSDMTCMIIGNGAYGRLAAQAFRDSGADCLVTVRQYHHGRINVPEGCRCVSYGDRYEWIPSCDIIVSATSSPHFTIMRDELKTHLVRPIVLVDMAIPSDIEPSCADLEEVELFDIDDFQTSLDSVNQEALLRTEELLAHEVEEFWHWVARRDAHEDVVEASLWARDNMKLRVQKHIDGLPLTRDQKDDLVSYVSSAAGRVLGRATYDLVDELDPDEFVRVVGAVAKKHA